MTTVRTPPNDELDTTALLTALRALRQGDFSARLPVRWLGMAGKVADTFNDIVEMNERLASELARLNRVVGKQGKITHRAVASGMAGGWVDCVVAVNSLIDDLVSPTQEMARVIGAVAKGDLSQAMLLDKDGGRLEGEFRRTATIVNSMVDQLGSFASEVTRVVREVGTEGKLGGQARVKRVAGTWKDLTDSVNSMAGNLTGQVRNIADVTTAVANGDLSKKITVDVKGE
ncbi:MAG: HAMP domain-containing protein, partial [Candidatus Rokuibacteriota bacterium]